VKLEKPKGDLIHQKELTSEARKCSEKPHKRIISTVYIAMGSRPQIRWNPDIVYPPMPDHVRKEIVDILADALVRDLQQNQKDKSIIMVSRSQTHNTTEETDNH